MTVTAQDGEQTVEDWQTEGRRRAQAQALHWAERADDHQRQANDADASVRAHEARPYVTKALDRHRADRALHTEQGANAVRLAEMWARVAGAFTP